MSSIKYPASELPPALKRLAATRKRSVFLHVVSSGHVASIRPSNWDGGCRTFTTAHRLTATGAALPVNLPSPEGFPTFRAARFPLPDDVVLTEAGTFRGKPATPTLTMTVPMARTFGLPLPGIPSAADAKVLP